MVKLLGRDLPDVTHLFAALEVVTSMLYSYAKDQGPESRREHADVQMQADLHAKTYPCCFELCMSTGSYYDR
jgi:hypothetical protein